MRNSTFKPPTYQEAMAKQAEAQKRALQRKKERDKLSTVKGSTRTTTGKKRANKKKTKSLAKYKKDLDAIFSKYVRLAHADNEGYVTCFTCGKIKHWKSQQNGHFVSRQYLATRWEEDNCRVQCAGCNVFGNGQLLDFEERLKKELGSDRVEELKAMRHQITKVDKHWYTEKILYYKTLVDNLL